jgi:hypothetical protein
MSNELSVEQIKAQVSAFFAPNITAFVTQDRGDELGFVVRSSSGELLQEFPPAPVDQLKNPTTLATRLNQFKV